MSSMRERMNRLRGSQGSSAIDEQSAQSENQTVNMPEALSANAAQETEAASALESPAQDVHEPCGSGCR